MSGYGSILLRFDELAHNWHTEMSNPSTDDNNNGFDYFILNLGFKVTVVIETPTDEGIQNGLNFLDPDQIAPLKPFLEEAALRIAGGNPRKSQNLLRSALTWESDEGLSQKEKIDGMKVLDAAFDARMKAFKDWQQKNLVPMVNKAEIVSGIQEAIGTALANFERIKCEELAEKVDYTLRTSLGTPEGTYKTKKVRGRRLSIFRANPGRTKGRKNTKPKVTYENIVKKIKGFKDNDLGIIPSEKQLALKFKCTPRTIKNCLRAKGETRHFSVFARAVLEEK
jgi:hypothetical protein